MEIQEGHHIGNLTVSGNLLIKGLISGNVTVQGGFRVVVRGLVAGDLIALPGSEVVIYGMVNGTVFNEGAEVEIFGKVDRVHDAGGFTKISEAAVVG